MMLNPMAAGRPEPQWTKYYAGNAFEDCEWRVEEMEILGVKQRYIMVRGTFKTVGELTLVMPSGVEAYYPMINNGFAIECYNNEGTINFGTTSVRVMNASSTRSILFYGLWNRGGRFLVFARVK